MWIGVGRIWWQSGVLVVAADYGGPVVTALRLPAIATGAKPDCACRPNRVFLNHADDGFHVRVLLYVLPMRLQATGNDYVLLVSL